EFQDFYPVDFSLWAKWRKAWGDIHRIGDMKRLWKMSLYHLKSKLRRNGKPLTSSYVLYARK
ncbi:MAG: class I SAM-dependent methyltransferase, partial [Spirochaetes bacterium]|nr:class I SAM-dependent methyltransferase [Spirochaetota bacterium]